MREQNVFSDQISSMWEKLNYKWNGEDADAYYKEYVMSIIDAANMISDTCKEINMLSSEFYRELQSFEQLYLNNT